MRFLITGGAGFIGSNAARRLSELGHEVVVFDNFSRAAAAFNRRWLRDGRWDMIYGDGLQVRDVLWVEDLVAAYLAAVERRERVAGKAYNIGGGPGFRLSLRELIGMLEGRLHRRIPLEQAPPRPGDQRVFYCDISRARHDLGWEPAVDPEAGVGRLLDWIGEDREETATFLARKGIPAAVE